MNRSVSQIEIKPVHTRHEKELFLTFPWRIYKADPLWVPPLLSERRKLIDLKRGKFFQDGYADLFIAWRDGKPVGTISCAEDKAGTRTHGFGECTIGFFECLDDYDIAATLFTHAEDWSRLHHLVRIVGTFNLDREESRGILIEGRTRPPAIYCGHNPPYYPGYFERFGFSKFGEDGLAYEINLDLDSPEIQHMMRLADKIRKRKNISIRSANLKNYEVEVENILDLQNRALEHLPEHIPYTRATIEAIILPMLDVVDPDLVLFAEIDGQAVGWFPGIPNFNEVFIHLNGLRHPWDYLRLLRYARFKPKGIALKSIAVVPEYWDTGVGVLLFDEMARRLVAKGYQWADMSLTGEYNTDTFPLAHRMGARIYKRYRFYMKEIV